MTRSTAVAAFFNAAAEFSGVSNPNPNGAWSQGYTKTLGSSLVLHDQFILHYSGDVDARHSSNGSVFEKNNGATTAFGTAPGQVALHPGADSQ